MYLYKKEYVGFGKEVEAEVKTKKWDDEISTKNYKNVSYIVREVGYWRKANEVHKWFVDKCGNGKDDCSPYPVTFEQLLELKSICQRILNAINSNHLTNGEKEDICEELLPTQPGFFFGSYNYDEWYKQDIENTIDIIENIEKERTEFDGDDYYYQASW